MKKVLTKKEEKFLINFEKISKIKGIYFITIITVLPFVSISELVMAKHIKNFDPIQSHDRYWLAALVGSWLVLTLAYFWSNRRIFKIIQKLRKP